jgi:transposase
MPETLILPDLDIMDAAALKAMVRAQHAQHAQYIATLHSCASEIATLKLLLDKLQQMLFGARSEKLVLQVAARTSA